MWHCHWNHKVDTAVILIFMKDRINDLSSNLSAVGFLLVSNENIIGSRVLWVFFFSFITKDNIMLNNIIY